MDEERDILVFTNDEGQEIELEILDYFEYDEEVYAMLVDAGITDDLDNEHGDDCECDHEYENMDVYIMKVIDDGESQEFIPVDDDKLDEIIKLIENSFDEDYDEDDYNEYDYDFDDDDDLYDDDFFDDDEQ